MIKKLFVVILVLLIFSGLIFIIKENIKDSEKEIDGFGKHETIEKILPYSRMVDVVITRDTITGVLKTYELVNDKITLKNTINAKNY